MKAVVKNPVSSEERGNERSSAPALTQEDLRTLKSVFPNDRLGVKVQSYSKDRTRAMLVLYLQHTDVQDRLEEVDPAWSTEVVGEERVGDTVYVRTRLTLKGVSRENVGEGGDPKAAYSDALKRAAMLFGVGRYLYDSPTVWTEYDDQRDRFKQWTVEDYEAALNKTQKRSDKGARPAAPSPSPASDGVPKGLKTSVKAQAPAETAAPAAEAPGPKAKASKAAAPTGKTGPRSREELNRQLMNLYRPYLAQFPQTQFGQLLQEKYSVGETRLMTVEQLEDLVGYMESRLRTVA